MRMLLLCLLLTGCVQFPEPVRPEPERTKSPIAAAYLKTKPVACAHAMQDVCSRVRSGELKGEAQCHAELKASLLAATNGAFADADRYVDGLIGWDEERKASKWSEERFCEVFEQAAREILDEQRN